jgi:hypothetical protein
MIGEPEWEGSASSLHSSPHLPRLKSRSNHETNQPDSSRQSTTAKSTMPNSDQFHRETLFLQARRRRLFPASRLEYCQEQPVAPWPQHGGEVGR